MRALILLLATLAFDAAAATPESALAATAPGSWIEYQVPLVDGSGSPCCVDGRHGGSGLRACALDGRDWNFSIDSAREDDTLRVFVRRGAAGADRVRALGASCAVDSGAARVHALGAIDADAAARWLAAQLAALDQRERSDAMAALALHAGSAATAALVGIAAPGSAPDQRRDALFWLGAARGADGLTQLRQALAQETDESMLRHVVFALGMSRAPGAAETLRQAARGDPRVPVRGEALFWLAQDHDPQTEALARAALAAGAGSELAGKAIFALSQLPPERAIPALDALARDRSQDAQTRRDALFWLAQQDGDGALALFDELLGNHD